MAQPALTESLLSTESQQDGGGIFDVNVPFRGGGIGLVGINPLENCVANKKNKFSLVRLRLLSSDASVIVGSVFHDPEATRTMTFGQLVMFTYLAAAGGPYGSEAVVGNGGPLLAVLGFLIVPWLFCFPLSMITAELATTMPEDGGIVRYIDRVMPKVMAFLAGYVTVFAGCITSSTNVVILVQYLSTVAPAAAVGGPGSYAVIGVLLLAVFLLNVLGISSIGPFSKWLSACILIPFAVMFLMSARYAGETGHLLGAVSPIIAGQGSAPAAKDSLQRFLGALVLNMLGFFLPAACAGSVQNVNTAFPRGMLLAVVLVIFNYVIPIMTGVLASRYDDGLWGCGPYPNAVQEGVDSIFQWSEFQCSPEFSLLSADAAAAASAQCNQCIGGKWTHWTTGYFSVVAYVLGGKPLQWIVVIVALVGQLGTTLSGICCNAYSLKALSDLNMMPKFVGWVHPKFNSPVVAICIIMSLSSFFSFFFNWYQVNGGGGAFDNLAFAASLLTLLVNSVMLIAFLMLRYQQPHLKRPFRIPLDSLFANILFCLPTFSITVFFLAICDPAKVVFLVIILSSGLCFWYSHIVLQKLLARKPTAFYESSLNADVSLPSY